MLPTNRDSDIVTTLREIFRDNWHGEVVRMWQSTPPAWPRTPANNSIFEPIDQQIKTTNLERTLDAIRNRFGFKALVYAKSAMHGGTAIQRASPAGGHNGGNSYD